MDTALKVTDQPEEIAFDDIVAGDNIINIPLFQRAYKWTEKNLTQFWDDLDSIIDESSKSHFLGVLVLVPQSRRVGQPVLLDIVDGQQRLSTCYLTILAMVQAAAEKGDAHWAVEVAKGFLLTRRFSNYSTNTKLIPSAADRQQFQTIWSNITNLKALEGADWGGEQPSPPQPSGQPSGRMTTAYRSLLRRAREVLKDEGMPGIEKLFDIVVGKLSFVTINLRSPTAAPAIFERLNARGERINISDLVRNEVFARVADRPAVAQSIFESHWEPFIDKFRRSSVDLEKLLFPYGLMLDPQITKADLFQALRSSWGEGEDPRHIIRALDENTPAFFALERGNGDELPRGSFRDAVLRLHQLGAPSSVYSFVFHLAASVKSQDIDSELASEIVKLVESFLVRRAVCGIEPTGLHAVFKGLWLEATSDNLSVESVHRGIARRSTVPWPGDSEFREAIVNSPLYGKRVAKFVISQLEKSTIGETPSDDFEIEHIFPKQPHRDWGIEVNEDVERLRNTWGNLIPLTVVMNPSVGNGIYALKRIEYQKAVFASPRQVASEYDHMGYGHYRASIQEDF
ncbi:MAG: DUF262 domain-containing protein [Hyphomonas sp.]|uniref:DUF262 domain-containing protein n=1 Tax=Hyphomonas sp. TaxID=87 RepID=UPI001B0D5C50|nr:DUF262 domain-containing HNH endonuclease family protein [Hyphomonas sp.]MBO6583330.1 DUF262 domain-containing protein [Hyphomonas sp.]